MAPRYRSSPAATALGRSGRKAHGFTLIELVIVMGILVMVLTATYRIMIDCLDAERTIDRLTLPEKVGEGILTLFRMDLSGTIWRQLGTRVFYVIDNGELEDSRDMIKFLSTVEPTPREETAQGSTVQVTGLRTITGIWYFLKPNQAVDGVPTLTLYRKEIVEFSDEDPLEAPGQNYEVYDKVAYLNIKCYDGYRSAQGFDPWAPAWDSETMIHEEQLDLEAAQPANEGIAKVTKRNERNAPVSGAPVSGAPGVNPATGQAETDLLPPAAVPSAVRVEIGIYAGQGNRIERDLEGSPILKKYATIVPILTAQRVRIETDEDLGLDDEGGVDGAAGGATSSGVVLPGSPNVPMGPGVGPPGVPPGKRPPGRGPGGMSGRGPGGTLGRGGRTVPNAPPRGAPGRGAPSIDGLLKGKASR